MTDLIELQSKTAGTDSHSPSTCIGALSVFEDECPGIFSGRVALNRR